MAKLTDKEKAALIRGALRGLGAGPIQAGGGEDEPELEMIDLGTGRGDSVPDALKDLLGSLLGKPVRRSATPEEVASFNQLPHPPLKVGDKVRWREGHRQGAWPEAGEWAVVSQVIEPPIRATHMSESTGGAERMDIALCFADESEGKVTVHEFVFDSRRFERWTEA